MEVNFNVIKKLGADCAIYLQYLVKNSGQSVQTSMDKVSKLEIGEFNSKFN